jgi:GntR family transcriptional regulator
MAERSSGAVLVQELDPSSDRPVFRQISDHLREAISAGRLSEGDQLPSEAQLIEHYGITRMTARQALGVLKAEGLVVSEHGRGSFVRTRPTVRRLGSDRFARRHRERGKAAFLAEVEGAGSKPSVDQITVSEERPSSEIAQRLKLSGGEKVVVRRRRYLIDGHPVEMATSFIPAGLAKGTPIAERDTGPGGIYARLEEMGHQLDHYAEEIRSRMPLPDEARVLVLSSGVPVFHLVRTAYDTNGRPVEVCDTVMSSDAYVLDYELPAR